MRHFLYLLSLLSVLLLAAGSPEAAARAAELIPAMELTLTGPDGQPLAAERVRAAILAGAASTGYPWVPQNETPGRIVLRTLVRSKHVVVVAAEYSAGRVRFDYVSSVEMNHKIKRDGTAVIHPNYMAWRAQLERAVRTAAARS